MNEPKPRKDGKCAGCGKPKKQTRAKKGANTGTRMERKLWLHHLETDPWCSRECCEAHHGVNGEQLFLTCAHPGCDNQFPADRARTTKKFCSKKCAEKRRKAAKFPELKDRCTGCAGDLENVTTGCAQCWDRLRRRRRRENPELAERDRVLWREARRRRTERKRLEAPA